MICMVVLLVLSIDTTLAFVITSITFLLLYVVFRILLFVLLFKRLEKTWESVKALRKGKSPFNPFDERFTIKVIDDELELLLKEKANEIDHLKEIEKFRKEFLSNVAHELRTPIFGRG